MLTRQLTEHGWSLVIAGDGDPAFLGMYRWVETNQNTKMN
jgi:hypothetical protein